MIIDGKKLIKKNCYYCGVKLDINELVVKNSNGGGDSILMCKTCRTKFFPKKIKLKSEKGILCQKV